MAINAARRLLGLLGLVSVVALIPVALAAAGMSWGQAIEVPGTATLSNGMPTGVTSVSCPTTGNCAAGGFYTDSSNHRQAFVADESNGVWGSAIEVPGTAALNLGGPETDGAEVLSVSCTSAANCAAGGYYTDSSDTALAFMVDERNGVWDNAEQAPGMGGAATSLSCASAGNCAAVVNDGVVAEEKNGVWGKAHALPGGATAVSVSCPSNGYCMVGGYGPRRATVIPERKGVWGTPKVFKVGYSSYLTSVSCASAGNCAVGGAYRTGPESWRYAFVAAEKRGVWDTAETVTVVDGTKGYEVESVSCARLGNCAAIGRYYPAPQWHGFIVAEKYGIWREATEVPGLAALELDGSSEADSISCAKAGSCAIGGSYYDAKDGGQSNHWHAFLTSP
jgi:hypothetical protein